MCSVGGPMEVDIDIKKRRIKNYECLECGKKFKVISRKAKCPECRSENVTELK